MRVNNNEREVKISIYCVEFRGSNPLAVNLVAGSLHSGNGYFYVNRTKTGGFVSRP